MFAEKLEKCLLGLCLFQILLEGITLREYTPESPSKRRSPCLVCSIRPIIAFWKLCPNNLRSRNICSDTTDRFSQRYSIGWKCPCGHRRPIVHHNSKQFLDYWMSMPARSLIGTYIFFATPCMLPKMQATKKRWWHDARKGIGIQ